MSTGRLNHASEKGSPVNKVKKRIVFVVFSVCLMLTAVIAQAQLWNYTWWHYCVTHNLSSNGGHSCSTSDVSSSRACFNEEYMPNGRSFTWDLQESCPPGLSCGYEATMSCTDPGGGATRTFSCVSGPGKPASSGRGWIRCTEANGNVVQANCSGFIH